MPLTPFDVGRRSGEGLQGIAWPELWLDLAIADSLTSSSHIRWKDWIRDKEDFAAPFPSCEALTSLKVMVALSVQRELFA
jgi:hypothetical protein